MAMHQPFTTTAPLVFNVDYFDWSQNAGYKRYYFLGTSDSVGHKYSLTDDSSIVGDESNRTTSTGDDLDFDLTFNSPVDVANATATISYVVTTAGAQTTTIIWTVYHYDGTTETSLGTVTKAITGTANQKWQATAQLTLTEKHFAAGDILRVNAAVTSTHAGTHMYYDPAGSISFTLTSTGTSTSSASINIPFLIQ